VTTREALHALVDSLPEGMVEPATRTLTELRDDPWAWALKNAPLDDEEYTEEDRAASERAWAGYRRGEFLTTTELDRRIRP
jgi:hypothetical protein